MLRFFVALLVLSLLALGGSYYWATMHPEGTASVAVPSGESQRSGGTESAPKVAPGANSADETDSSAATRSLSTRKVVRLPSDIQSWSVWLSLASSVLSAFGTLISLYFTWSSWRERRLHAQVRE